MINKNNSEFIIVDKFREDGEKMIQTAPVLKDALSEYHKFSLEQLRLEADM